VPLVPLGGFTVDRWEVLNDSGVALQDVADFDSNTSFSGVMITTRKSGDYVVKAHAGTKVGIAAMHITQANPSLLAFSTRTRRRITDRACSCRRH
jgi:hypothetical protein